MFRWSEDAPGRWSGTDGAFVYRIAETLEGDLVRLEVETNGTQEDFERLFRLDVDGAALEEEILRVGPELAPAVAALQGLRVLRPSDSNEIFFSFLCTPNNHLPRILSMVRHLAEYGDLSGQEEFAVRRFPSAERIAEIPEEALRGKGFGYRARTIPEIARQVLARGEGWIESLKDRPYPEAHEALCEITGIGPKLADCIALFALDHLEAVPIDTHMWQAVKRFYFPDWEGASLTPARYKEASEFLRGRFGASVGWAQQFLFYENMLRKRPGASKS